MRNQKLLQHRLQKAVNFAVQPFQFRRSVVQTALQIWVADKSKCLKSTQSTNRGVVMKRVLAVLFIVSFLFTALPAQLAYAKVSEYKETVFDQVGDWGATLGKSGLEKDKILAERKAQRMQRHMEKMTKEAAKDAEKAGKDLKKKMGF